MNSLDLIEKAATAKGEIDLVAAVVKEREAAVAGTLEPTLPAALPKAKLQMARKTLLASTVRINDDFAKRKKMADADYLKMLAALQPKVAANPELAKQVAAEKAAVLGGDATAGAGGGTGKGAAAKVSHGKNVVVNGDFEKVVDGKPEGWELRPGVAGCVTIVTEENSTFVRFEAKPENNDGTANVRLIRRDIDVPKGAKTVTVSARLRTKDCVSVAKIEPTVPQGSSLF